MQPLPRRLLVYFTGPMDLSSHAAIIIGIFVGVVSTSVQSLGLTLQRKSHLLEEERPSQRPPYRRRRWQIGMGLFITSNILGSSVQIGTLPLVILSPLQASGLVFNSICASALLGEPFTLLSLIGTVLVCLGAGLIAIFGTIKEPVHNLDELILLLYRRGFLVWLVGQGKDAVGPFTSWPSWIIVISLVAAALFQLFYLHKGLKLCSTSVLYPLVFCVYNIFAISNGLIYYNQAGRLSTLSSSLIALGVFILLSGVLALSWRLEQSSQPFIQDADDGPSMDEESERTHLLTGPPSSASVSEGWLRYLNVKSVSFIQREPSPTLPTRYGTIPRRRTITETREILAELESESDSSSPTGDHNRSGQLEHNNGTGPLVPT
ncbi:hypothetical protein TWF703_008501 [Orbilia oligospora]|uniref:Uncharacterized protein n=1 Tax=Orbilia oligospora TaxID=2813651 RepID=A0A7C8JNW3_ORBOL|nr:hypothetical protein TWF703_008501 [Orbilia oligospora]